MKVGRLRPYRAFSFLLGPIFGFEMGLLKIEGRFRGLKIPKDFAK